MSFETHHGLNGAVTVMHYASRENTLT
jgi:hypothetical protein